MTADNTFAFDYNDKAVKFNGSTIIDLSAVEREAQVKVYSRLENTSPLLETLFEISESERPFVFGHIKLCVRSFIASIIENKVEIDGMSVSPSIHEAYSQLWQDIPVCHPHCK